MTLISVIVPCFNQAEFLDECLNSVYCQTYPNWECIVVDDGSTDNTSEIAGKWTLKETRISYIYQGNQGLSAARNTGLALANGNYIQFLDADDFLKSNKLLSSLDKIKNTSNNLIISNFLIYDTVSKMAKPPYCDLSKINFTLKSIILDWDKKFTIPIHCALINRTLLEDFIFPKKLKAKEDWIMWVAIFKKRPNVNYIDEQQVFYRSHTNNMCLNSNFMEAQKKKALAHLRKQLSLKEYWLYILKPYINKNYLYRLKRKLIKKFNQLK